MSKKVVQLIKLQIPAGKANPAPPVGPALGQHGLNIQDFCSQFNAKTQGMDGIVPVVISVHEDKSFSFIMKTPPAAELIKKEAGIKKGSPTSHKTKVAEITKDQVRKIAEIKLPDLNAHDIEQAMKVIAGTARSMGVTVKE